MNRVITIELYRIICMIEQIRDFTRVGEIKSNVACSIISNLIDEYIEKANNEMEELVLDFLDEYRA